SGQSENSELFSEGSASGQSENSESFSEGSASGQSENSESFSEGSASGQSENSESFSEDLKSSLCEKNDDGFSIIGVGREDSFFSKSSNSCLNSELFTRYTSCLVKILAP